MFTEKVVWARRQALFLSWGQYLWVMECTQSTMTSLWRSRCVDTSINISIHLNINYIILSWQCSLFVMALCLVIQMLAAFSSAKNSCCHSYLCIHVCMLYENCMFIASSFIALRQSQHCQAEHLCFQVWWLCWGKVDAKQSQSLYADTTLR